MDRLYLVMPAYNEEETIEMVVEAWYPIVDAIGKDSKLVVADSGSNDQTHLILQNLQTKFPQLQILSETGKQHGPKLIALYQYAIQQGADYIFQTDSDGQTSPAEFDAFWSIRANYDAILGHRKIRGDGAARAFVEKVVCLLLKIYFRVDVPDANAPFRLMKAKTVNKYISMLSADFNLPNIMLTTYFAYYHEAITFKEISFQQRQGGINSINIPKIIKIGWKALWDFRSLKRAMEDRHDLFADH